MSVTLTALELEQKANKLLETLKRRSWEGKENISFLASELLDWYNDGYNQAIVTLGGLK